MPDMTVKVKYVIAALFCADKVRTINIINETANMIGDIRKAHILLLKLLESTTVNPIKNKKYINKQIKNTGNPIFKTPIKLNTQY